MTTLTITSKGQMTLKKSVLQHIGVHPGEQVEVELLPHGQALLRAKASQGGLDSFVGLFAGSVPQPIDIEEMNQVAASGWAGEYDDHS